MTVTIESAFSNFLPDAASHTDLSLTERAVDRFGSLLDERAGFKTAAEGGSGDVTPVLRLSLVSEAVSAPAVSSTSSMVSCVPCTCRISRWVQAEGTLTFLLDERS